MLELLTAHPWLALCGMITIGVVACVAIVFISDYLKQGHQAEIDATLKQDMLSRGMSAADIKTVLEARSDGEATRLAMAGNSGAVRVGLGKFQVEVGGTNPASNGT